MKHGATASLEDVGVCIPDGVTTLQAIQIVLKYIRQNPERAHLQSVVLLVEAEPQ